jgi:predicted ATPase
MVRLSTAFPHNCPILWILAFRSVDVKKTGKQTHEVRKALRNMGNLAESPIAVPRSINVREYVCQRFPGNKFPDTLIEQVQKRTGGHALFVRSVFTEWQRKRVIFKRPFRGALTWMLTPSKAIDISVPNSIEEFTDERLEKMTEDLKYVLSSASVEGDTFRSRTVSRCVGMVERRVIRDLHVLEKEYEMVFQLAPETIGASTIKLFSFAHPFFRERIYEKLGEEELRELHLLIGEALEELYQDELQAVSAMLVRHFEIAQYYEKAAHYALKASQAEQQRSVWVQSVENCKQGIEIAEKIRDEKKSKKLRLELLDQLGTAYHRLGECALAIKQFEAAIALGEQIDIDAEYLVKLHTRAADACSDQGQAEGLRTHVGQGKAIFEKNNLPHAETYLDLLLIEIWWDVGGPKTAEAIGVFRHIISEAERLPQTTHLVLDPKSWTQKWGFELHNTMLLG